jgi:Protein of unknown function (DUF4238)
VTNPRNHHYVPQAYLLGFAGDGGRVCVRWRMSEDPIFLSNVRNVASERDFYSFVNDHTGLVDHKSFEAGLNASEGMLRDSLREYIYGPATAPVETLRLRIALGVGFQMSRTKYFRRKVERISDYAARSWATHERPDLAEAFDFVHVLPGNDLHLTWIRDWAQRLAVVLLDRSWFILRTTTGRLITSDNPVYGIARRTDALDVGVLAASEIRYPVDASTALAWTPEPRHDAAILLSSREVSEFNTATYANAYEQAYGYPDDQPELERLPRHRDTLIERINAMVEAPAFTKPGTRRFRSSLKNDDA